MKQESASQEACVVRRESVRRRTLFLTLGSHLLLPRRLPEARDLPLKRLNVSVRHLLLELSLSAD